jgi:hypothetical protein
MALSDNIVMPLPNMRTGFLQSSPNLRKDTFVRRFFLGKKGLEPEKGYGISQSNFCYRVSRGKSLRGFLKGL